MHVSFEHTDPFHKAIPLYVRSAYTSRLLDSVMYIACNSAKFCTRHLYYPFIEQTYAKTFVADMDASKAGITRRVSKNFALSFVTDLVIRTDGDCSTHRIEMKKILLVKQLDVSPAGPSHSLALGFCRR